LNLDKTLCDFGTLCLNGGSCVSTNMTSFVCHCPEGYTGETCNTTFTTILPTFETSHITENTALLTSEKIDATESHTSAFQTVDTTENTALVTSHTSKTSEETTSATTETASIS